jgi:hypothetical protein
MDDPKLIKTLSRRQIGRLERFGESRVPARRAVAASSAVPVRIGRLRLPVSLAGARIARKATSRRT